MADDKSGKPPPLMGATAIRPPERHGMEKYTHILYDPKNGTFLTRTPKSWALITLFYLIYYSCLAGFWMACMTIFLKIQIQVPSDNNQNAKPTWLLKESIIGKNPGLGVRPSQTVEELDSGIFDLDDGFSWETACPNANLTLAKLKGTTNWTAIEPQIDACIQEDVQNQGKKDEKWKKNTGYTMLSKGYAYRAWEFLKIYRDNEAGNWIRHKDALDCEDKDKSAEGYRITDGKFCHFKLDKLKADGDDKEGFTGCHQFPYGYDKSNFQPCIFLKFNRIMDLEPIPLNKKNIDEQDDSIKKDTTSRKFLDSIKDAKYPNRVFVNCEGDYPADKEILSESMNLFPKNAAMKDVIHGAEIDLSYFPYDKYRINEGTKKGSNENPLIAIQFKGLEALKASNNRLIHIVCKAYYDGVIHSKKDKAGLVKFEVFFKKPTTEDKSEN